MKEIEELYDNDFILRIKTDISYGYANSIILESLTKDSTKDNSKKLINETRNGKNLPNYLCLGNCVKEDEYIKPIGRLAIVPLYTQHADDMMAMYYSTYEGCAIIDRNLKIVHMNTKNTERLLADKNDALNLLYVYGPCAMAFLEPKDIDEAFVKNLKETYAKRVAALHEKTKDVEKIAKEQELFDKTLNVLERENKKLLDASMEF